MRISVPWIGVSMGLLLFAALLGYDVRSDRLAVEATERDRLLHQTSVVEKNLDGLLLSASRVLESIRDEWPALREPQPPASPVNRRLASKARAVRGIVSLSIVDADGTVLASNLPEAVGLNFRDSERYRVIRSGGDAGVLYLSEPFQTAYGDYALGAGRVVRDGQGRFDGYVLAIFSPDFFRELLESVLYAPDARALIVHRDGKIVFRAPDAERLAGTDLARAPGSAFPRFVASGQPIAFHEGSTATYPGDRLAVYYTVQAKSVRVDKPLVFTFSRDRNAAYARWNKDFLEKAILLVLVSSAAIAGLVLYRRRQAAIASLQAAREADRASAAERLQMATEGAEAGTWYWDLATGRQEWSDRCKAHLALPEGGQPSFEHFYRVVHPDDRARVEHAVREAVDARRDYSEDYRVVLPDGATRWVRAFGRVFLHPDGSLRAMGGVTLDVTAAKAAEGELAERSRQVSLLNVQLEKRAEDAEVATRAKEAFLRNVSHELRTPLSHVLGGTEILLQGHADEEQRRWLATIQRSARDLLRQVEDILAASSGEVELAVEVFSPAKVLDEVRVLMAPAARGKGLAFDVKPAAGLPPRVRGDPARLAQALLVYAENAIKFTPAGGIALDARVVSRPEGEVVVRFEVQDSGIGIDAAARAKLFTTFSQADDSTTRHFSGLGLGLARVLELARRMGGEAGVDSEPGRGSTFWFTARFGESGAPPEPATGEAVPAGAMPEDASPPPATPAGAGPVDAKAVLARLAQLEVLLDRDDVEAQSVLQEARAALEAAVGHAPAQALADAVERFDFEAALAAVRRLRERLAAAG